MNQRSVVFLFFLPLLLAADIHLPPLFTYMEENPVLKRKNDIQILGPFLEMSHKNKTDIETAIRPLFSWKKEDGRTGMDFLWPLCGSRQRFSGSDFWILPYYHFATDDSPAQTNYIFPFVYLTKKRDGRWSWFVFPLYGDFSGYLNLGDAGFVLWPLYVFSRRNGMANHYLIWPLFGWGSGDAGKHIRVLPFYISREEYGRRVTRSYLWPLLTVARSLNENNPGYAVLSFPFGGYEDWGPLINRSILWPFFTWKSQSSGSYLINAPWPFIRFGSGTEGQRLLNFWPLYGSSVSETSRHAFFLWPLGIYLKNETDTLDERWMCVLPFYCNFTKYRKKENKNEYRWRHVWPLVSVVENDKTCVVRGLDLIPIKRLGGWERNLQPWFTLFEYTGTPDGDTFEIFWNMFGMTRTENLSKFHIGPLYSQTLDSKKDIFELKTLFGLYQYRREGKKSRNRFFYFLDIPVKE